MQDFLLFPAIFAIFDDFFRVLQHIWYSTFLKTMKYCKKFGENEEKSFNYSITKMATLGTKNVHSAEAK